MMRAWKALTLIALLLVIAPAPAETHEKAVLKSPASEVAAGGRIPLAGADFSEGLTYVLRLASALDEHRLREITPDAKGLFAIELEIPVSVRPGSYRLEAVAPDGDVVASLDLTILAGPAASAGHTAMDHMVEDPEAGRNGMAMEPGARADEIVIERPRTGAEWGVIGLLIGLAGGLGIGLLRRA